MDEREIVLRQMFPDKPDQELRRALDTNDNDLNLAIDALLNVKLIEFQY